MTLLSAILPTLRLLNSIYFHLRGIHWQQSFMQWRQLKIIFKNLNDDGKERIRLCLNKIWIIHITPWNLMFAIHTLEIRKCQSIIGPPWVTRGRMSVWQKHKHRYKLICWGLGDTIKNNGHQGLSCWGWRLKDDELKRRICVRAWGFGKTQDLVVRRQKDNGPHPGRFLILLLRDLQWRQDVPRHLMVLRL